MKPGLYFVPTPIGNLGDMTYRALEVLRTADEIWAEDTRNLRKLLNYFDIQKKTQQLFACHDHNEREMTGRLVAKIEEGKVIAYASDAGMPLISDPGFRLVKATQEAKLYYTVLPGASAVPTALALSGMPTDRFAFLGFVPTKDGKRRQFFEEIKGLDMSAVAFDSPRRLMNNLEAAKEILGAEQNLAVVREISKTFEEVAHGSIDEVMASFAERDVKGEIVIVFAPAVLDLGEPEQIADELKDLLETHRVKEAAKIIAERHSLSRNDAYKMALDIVNQDAEN